MGEIQLKTPFLEKDLVSLTVGDFVYLTGEACLMRGLAHARFVDYLENTKELPFNLEGGIIYHAYSSVIQRNGNWLLNYVGPSLSFRMEKYLRHIIPKIKPAVVIGKAGAGLREETAELFARNKCVHLVQIGGTPAYYRKMINNEIRVLWEDLGPEKAVLMKFKEFGPLVVSVDTKGNQIFNAQTYTPQELYK